MQWYRSAHHRSRQREMDRWCQKHKVGFVRENVCCPSRNVRSRVRGMSTRAAAKPALAPRPDQTPARRRTCTLPLACFTYRTTRPGDPARPATAGDRALAARVPRSGSRHTPRREIRFDLLNYALGSPCQPATTSPAIHRAHDRASPSSPVATCGWPRYTPPRTRYTYMHVAGVTRQNSIAEQSTP